MLIVSLPEIQFLSLCLVHVHEWKVFQHHDIKWPIKCWSWQECRRCEVFRKKRNMRVHWVWYPMVFLYCWHLLKQASLPFHGVLVCFWQVVNNLSDYRLLHIAVQTKVCKVCGKIKTAWCYLLCPNESGLADVCRWWRLHVSQFILVCSLKAASVFWDCLLSVLFITGCLLHSVSRWQGQHYDLLCQADDRQF